MNKSALVAQAFEKAWFRALCPLIFWAGAGAVLFGLAPTTWVAKMGSLPILMPVLSSGG